MKSKLDFKADLSLIGMLRTFQHLNEGVSGHPSILRDCCSPGSCDTIRGDLLEVILGHIPLARVDTQDVHNITSCIDSNTDSDVLLRVGRPLVQTSFSARHHKSLLMSSTSFDPYLVHINYSPAGKDDYFKQV